MIEYGFTKKSNLSFETAVDRVIEALKKEGFGILTTIDIKEKFKEKLGIDFQNYVILGACHPSSAHKAILAEENIGLMLPCNVVVFEKNDHVVLSVIKPSVAMDMIENDELKQIAISVESKLESVFESIGD
ncbi:MAG: DUF302 domain-containing protein [Thermoplasmatota archaeon]